MEKLTLEDLDNLRIEEMNADELRELLIRLEELYDEISAMEPDEPDDDEESDEYDEWLETVEDIDDLMDDIQDRLERLS